MVDITIVNGDYKVFFKPTSNCGAPSCTVFRITSTARTGRSERSFSWDPGSELKMSMPSQKYEETLVIFLEPQGWIRFTLHQFTIIHHSFRTVFFAFQELLQITFGISCNLFGAVASFKSIKKIPVKTVMKLMG